ncbi:VOC family protein [Virgibacillus byunsanensis]|uniref:VOC family protein n=1 Tax=Virgibacillus byunsanensis TaxID=570945 RepID=A0ABW3LME1_9BACI
MEQKFFREPNTYVGHVELKVKDLARSLKFYKEVIGFQLLEQTEHQAVLSADGKTALLTIVQPENVMAKQGNTTGLYHYAILLPSRVELGKVLKHFIALNQPLGSSDHLVSEALYLSDPDGNGIEIYIDRHSSDWNWNHGQVEMTVDPIEAKSILAEAEGETWSGLPTGTVMGHIHLHVSELQKTEEFYSKGLGFDTVCRFGQQALFMSTGSYHHHIGLNTWAGVGAPAAPKNGVGLKVFSLVYPNEKSRGEVVEQLRTLGYEVQEEHGAFITEDPSGNRIQLSI